MTACYTATATMKVSKVQSYCRGRTASTRVKKKKIEVSQMTICRRIYQGVGAMMTGVHAAIHLNEVRISKSIKLKRQ